MRQIVIASPSEPGCAKRMGLATPESPCICLRCLPVMPRTWEQLYALRSTSTTES